MIRAELGGWTRDGIVRQAAFKGFDEGGKKATEVVRERPVATAATVEAVEAELPDADDDGASEATDAGLEGAPRRRRNCRRGHEARSRREDRETGRRREACEGDIREGRGDGSQTLRPGRNPRSTSSRGTQPPRSSPRSTR